MTHPLDIEELLSHAGWLRGLARSLVHEPAAAEDLVQDTWLAALRQPPGREPRAWLARVARNLAHNARRGAGRRTTREALAHEERPSASPPELLAEAEAQRLLAEAVTHLPEELRVVVVLHHFRGLDSAAIGRELGLSPSAVRTRLQRALEALRIDLDRRFGGDRRAWVLLLARLGPEAEVATAAGLGLAGGALGVLALGLCTTVLAAFLVDGSEQEEAHAEASMTGLAPQVRTPSGARNGPVGSTRLPARSDAMTGVPPTPVEPGGVELAGRILIDGAPAEWPVELWIEPPEGVEREAWYARLGAVPRHVVTTPLQPERFRFGLLDADWSGRLRVENASFANGTDRLAIESPRSDLTLHLRSGPALTGRLVPSPGMRPGLFQYSIALSGESGSNRSWRYTNLQGRFRAPIPGTELGGTMWAVLLVEADERGYLYQHVPGFEAARGVDVGDLALEPVRSVTVRVRDGLGKPLAGAVARVVGPPPSWARASDPADELGETTLRFVPERTASMRVSALCFADRIVEVGPFAAPEVVLAPLASLEVVRAGDPPGALTFERLVVHATEPIYGDGDESEIEQELQLQLGATQPLERSRGPGPGSTNRIVYRSEPRYLLTGLRPGVPLQIEARAADETVLWRHVLTLAPGEWARVELPRGP